MERLVSLNRFPIYVPGKTVRKKFGCLEVVITPCFVWVFNNGTDPIDNRLLPVKRISKLLFASRIATKMDTWEAKQLTEEIAEIASK